MTGASAASGETAYRWHSVAIRGGGFVSGIVFHPREKGLAYVRTDVGGAYRWDERAREWVALMDWLGRDDVNLIGIESIAIDPTDPARVYLAAGTYTGSRSGNGAILRSADRGSSFQRTDLPFKLGGNEMGRGNGERLAVDPNDGRALFFGSRGAGLWRSDDAGASFAEVKSFPDVAKSEAAGVQTTWAGLQHVGIVFVVFDPASGKPGAPTPKLFAGVSTRETSLYESGDGGRSWNAVKGQPKGLRPNHMVRAADGNFYLSYGDEPGPDTMHNGAVWKYVPVTGRWEDVTPAPQSTDAKKDGFGWGAVATDPHNPKVLLATTFCRYRPYDDIFRSIDGGRSWVPLLSKSRFDHSNAPWTRDAFPHWMADIKIDPFDSDHTMFVTGYGLWAARNLGAVERGGAVQWQFENEGLEETVALALVSPAQGAQLLTGVGDIDGFRHDDLDTPTLQFAGPRLTNTYSMAIAGQAPQVVVRSGVLRNRRHDEVRAVYSRDGGATWQAFAGEPPQGEGGGHITVAADGKHVIWTPRKSGAWITSDFGANWQKVRGLPDSAAIEADKVDERLYYAFDAAGGTLYLSGNGGEEFELKETVGASGGADPWSRPELRPDPRHGAVMYLAAFGRGLLRWSAGRLARLPHVEVAESLGLGRPKDGSDMSTLFVSGKVDGMQGLFRSDDDGRNWQRIDDDAHRFGAIRLVTGDPKRYGRVYFAGSGRGVLYGDPR
jgi:photosystem II stability/assembly factor-like uncharacterized protein